MTDLIPYLAHRLGLKPELFVHNSRWMRIASHYRKETERGHMRLSIAVDRAYGDICGQNRAEGNPQNDQPRYS